MIVPSVERTITVAQPLPAVWRFLSDYTTTEEWDPPTISTERTGGDGGLGTTYHTVARFRGNGTEIDYVVTEYVELERLTLRGQAASMRLDHTMTVAGTPGGGTRVTYLSEVTVRDDVDRLTTPLFDAGLLDELADVVAESLQDSLEHLELR